MAGMIVATLLVSAVFAAGAALFVKVRVAAPFGQAFVAWWLLFGAALGAGFLQVGPVGLVLALVVVGPPTLIWTGFRRALPHGPRPSTGAEGAPAVREAVAALEGRGMRAGCWTEQGRRPRFGTDTTVSAAHLLTPDGRTLCTLQGRRKGRVFTTVTSVIAPGRWLTTTVSVPFRADNRVSQRFTGLTPAGMLERHGEAVALCESLGLRLTPLADHEVAAVIEQGWTEMRGHLDRHGLGMAYGVWFQLVLRRVTERGAVADRPAALGRLRSWRDDQLADRSA